MPDPVSFMTGAASFLNNTINSNKSTQYKGSLSDFVEYEKQKYKEDKFGLTDYDKAFLYNSSIAAYQNDLALQNWNRENAYNTPAAQMQRFLEAGLNPNLVYGAGASSGNAGNIGTPTVGGQVSPTEIQDSRTRRAAQKMNAWQTALGMLGSSLDVFQKLMTVRGTIKATNAENSANASQGVFNRDYWNTLNNYGGNSVADLKAGSTVAQWMADRQNAELANRIALYKTFNNGGLTPEEIENKPYYARLLDTQLENSQADLTWQNLMNDFKKLDWNLANDPDFGLKRFKQTEYDLLKSRLKLQRSAYKLNLDRHDLNALNYKIQSKYYDWFDANQLTRSFFPMLKMLSEVW